MEDCVTRLISQPEDTSVTFDLCTDKEYSFQVHLLNAGGGMATISIHLSIILFTKI